MTQNNALPSLSDQLASLVGYAESEASTLSELARDDPACGREAVAARRTIARVSPLLNRLPDMLTVLHRAERFIAGFEGDETQEGVDELLQELRAFTIPG